MVGVLKKEVMKTQSKELEKGAEYRQLLVQAIHSWCALNAAYQRNHRASLRRPAVSVVSGLCPLLCPEPSLHAET